MNKKSVTHSIYRLFSMILLVSLLFSNFQAHNILPVQAQEASTTISNPAGTITPEQGAAVPNSGKTSKPITSQFIIHFKNNVTDNDKKTFVHAHGGSVVTRIDKLNVMVIRLPDNAQGQPNLNSPIVESVEQDYYIDVLDDIVPPNDPRYAEQWALPAIGAPSAWAQLPADAPKTTVAVIDSGICASHPDFVGRIVDGWDFLESDAVPQDDFGHGCSVSGVIAANMNNDIGIAGVAPNAQIMPLRVLNASGVGSYSDVAAAIVYAADHGAQVVNLSLGGSNPSSALESAVNYAISKGVIIVAAAGNNGTEGALYPAAYPDVIAVGSVDSSLQHSSFSNYGAQIDIWAPGRDILTTKRDGSYGLASGTSFAAPYVAGAEALNTTLNYNLLLDGEILSLNAQAAQATLPAVSSTPTEQNTEEPTSTDTPLTNTPTYPCNTGIFRAISLDGVDLQLCIPFNPDHASSASQDDWVQSGSWIKLTPRQEFSIYAIPYGVNPAADNLTVATAGITDEYKKSTFDFYKSDALVVKDGPSISIFGNPVQGVTYLLPDKNNSGGNSQKLVTEWIVEAGNRVWVVRSVLYGDFSNSTVSDGLLESLKIIFLESQNLGNLSTSLEQHQKKSTLQSSENVQSLSDLPFPSWWDGNCDSNRYSRITGISSYQLTVAPFRGLIACGPGSAGTTYPYGLSTSFGAGVSQYEFQCAELPKRYLYLLYGLAPKSADGINVVNVYDNALPNLKKVTNGTANSGLAAGDIISYDGPTSAGHTAIITSVSIDGNGNGSYTTIEQNSSASGTRTNTISNWWLNSNSGISVYLHDSGSSGGGGGSSCKATTTTLPSGYAKCAEEGSGNFCNFSGTLTVYYGANSCFDIENKTNGVECTNTSFGGDPLDGVHKACYINGGSSSGSWSTKYFNGHDHWWDTNNFNNQMCSETLSSTGLDKNYGSTAPCNNGVYDNWVAEYNANINFSSGNYVFQVENDDGLKLWVNNINILERGGSGGLSYVCPARPLNGNVPIRAILNEEGGDARVKITWTTDTSVCNPPGSFNKSSPSSGASGQPTNPTISWGNSSGANSYSYCIDTLNNNSCDTGWQGVGNTTSKALSGLTAGTTYYWHVRANSDGGETYSNGNTWWAFTVQTPGPGAFNKTGPSNNATGQSTSPSLAWEASSGATSYEYCIDTVNDNACSWISNNANRSISLSNLSSNTTYYWHVRASNAGGTTYANGGSTAFWSFTTAATAPGAPSLSSPGNGSSNPYNQDLTFQWNSSSGATEYQVEWWGGPYSTMQPCGWSASTSCHVGSVWSGYTYSWHVRARNSYGTSGWSPTWTFAIQPAPLPDLVPFPRPNASDPVVVSRWQDSPYTDTVLSGQTAYFYWGFKNNGQSNAGAFHVKVYVDNSQFIDYPFDGLYAGYDDGFDNWAETFNLTPGPHQVKIVVDANNQIAESDESNNTWTGTVDWRDPIVQMNSVFTTDDLGPAQSDNIIPAEDASPSAYKDTFNLGDPIRLYLSFTNEFLNDQTFTAEWQVTNPAGRIVPELSTTDTTTLGSGGWWWWTSRTIPENSLRGEYTFVGKITHNGVTTTKTATFTVAGAPSVEVYDVFVTDENGNATSLEATPQVSVPLDVRSESAPTFNAGDGIQLYIDTYNDVADGETASFTWEVIDPWGRWVEELSWSGDLASSLGESWWHFSSTVPDHAITGDYTFTGYITHGDRTTQQSQTFHVNGSAGPANDSFSSPITVGSIPYTDTKDTWGATIALTDPTPGCGNGKNSNSVWYRYTAPSNGLLEINTWGSSYDTVLALWTGTSGNLNQVSCNDDMDGYIEARLDEVSVTAGVTYYIEVMDYGNPGGGHLELYVGFAPSISNNDFNNAAAISTNPFNATLNTGGATKASDDPILTTCNRLPGEASVWYRYTPTWTGELQLDTKGSDYDTMLAVWTGTRGNLNSIDCNDDIGDVNGDWDSDSILTVPLNAGITYYIEVSTFAGKIDANGASANELENKPVINLGDSSLTSLQDLKSALENEGAPVSVSSAGMPDEIGAQFWGGQLQLHAAFHPVPGAFIKVSPSNLAANQSLNPVISWGSSSNAESYEYCYDTTNDSTCSTWISSGTTTSTSLSGLEQYTTYYWHVRAVNSIGTTYVNGNATTFWSFTTGGVPGGFVKAGPTDGATNQPLSFTVSWSASSNATSYEYCYDTTNDNACSSWQSNGISTSRQLTGLGQYTTYYWQVRAVNSFGTSYSDGASTTYKSFSTGGIPGAFSKLSPTNGVTNQSLSVTINWGTSNNAASYEYCYDTTNDNACSSWQSNGTSTSKQLTGLSQYTTYYWQVRAVNSFGTSYSDGASTTYRSFGTGGIPGAFSKLSPTNGVTNQSLSVTINWGTSNNAASYEYCYDTTNDNACSSWQSNGTSTSKQLAGLSQYTTYYWQVRAVNSFGTSYSDGASTTYRSFSTGGMPGAFNKLSPANGASNQPLSLTLTWSPSSNATSYEYCYDTTDDDACLDWISTGTSTSASLSGLELQTTYYWHVRSSNSFGTSFSENNDAASWTFTTGTPPATFSKMTPSDSIIGQKNSLTLSWGASGGASSYEYCYDTTNDNACSYWQSNGISISKIITGLSYDTTYYWQVRAKNGIGMTYADGDGGFWSFTTGHLPTAFNKISPLHLSTNQNPSITLSWGSSTDVDFYEYCYDSTNDNICSTWLNNGLSSSVALSGLGLNTTYYWQVRAVNTAGTTYANSISTNFWSFKTIPLPGAFSKTTPANLALKQSTSPILTWGASTSASEYQYCYDTINNNICDTDWISHTGTSAALVGLSNNTTYYWQVRAVNAGGVTYANAGTWWNFKVIVSAPTLVSPNNGELTFTLRPVFDWDDVDGASGYSIQIAAVSNFSTLVTSGTTPANATSYTPTVNLPAGKTLYWRVRANGANGPSLWTTGNFISPTPPSTATLLLPANASLNTNYTPTLKWSVVTSVVPFDHYRVQVDDDPLFGSPEVDDLTYTLASQNTLTTPALTHNTKFYWRVLAFNQNGQYSTSAVWSLRTALLPMMLDPLPNDNHPSVLRPTFNWTDPNTTPLATGYSIQIAAVSNFSTLVTSGTAPASAMSYTPTINLPAGKTLYWRVRANGANGPSLWTTGNFISPTPPSTATLLLPANTSLNTNYTPTLKWSVVTSVVPFDHYRVQVDDDPLFGSPEVDDLTYTLASQNTLTTPALTHNTKFYWRVLAFNQNGQYSTSAVWSLRTITDAPTLIAPANGAPAGTLKPAFDWDAPTGPVTSYTLQVATSPTFGTLLVNSTTVDSTYTRLTNLPVGKTLFWRVKANGVNGPSPWSSTFSFTTP